MAIGKLSFQVQMLLERGRGRTLPIFIKHRNKLPTRLWSNWVFRRFCRNKITMLHKGSNRQYSSTTPKPTWKASKDSQQCIVWSCVKKKTYAPLWNKEQSDCLSSQESTVWRLGQEAYNCSDNVTQHRYRQTSIRCLIYYSYHFLK